MPAPLRAGPPEGTNYSVPNLLGASCSSHRWNGDSADQKWLGAGLVHATAETAMLHGKALLALSAP